MFYFRSHFYFCQRQAALTGLFRHVEAAFGHFVLTADWRAGLAPREVTFLPGRILSRGAVVYCLTSCALARIVKISCHSAERDRGIA
jgi:hypothetical protein